jgi:hypothetical protein
MIRNSKRRSVIWLGLLLAAVCSSDWFVFAPTQAQQAPAAASSTAASFEDLAREVRRLTSEVERLNQRVAELRPQAAAAENLPPRPEPRLSAEEMLQRKLQGIEAEIQRSRQAGRTDEARAWAAALDGLKQRLLTGKFEAAPQRELHVVGLYEGGSRRLQVGSAEVHVTWRGAPVVLCLCAYSQIEWTITVAEGVQLEQIILAGYHAQTVGKAPDGVPVENRSGRDARAEALRGVYTRTDESSDGGFREFAQDVKSKTGLDIRTFQGAYRYEGRPIVVGPESAAWRVERLLPEADELYLAATRGERGRRLAELRHLRFEAVYSDGNARSYGQFSVLGPISSTLRPVNGQVHQLAVDPRGPTYYGKGGHEVLLVDLDGQSIEELHTGDSIPRFSWLSAIAFDSKRQRLLATTFGGGGYLYAYSPANRAWSVLAEPGLASSALTYVAAEDALYGLDNAMGPGALIREVYRFSPVGARLQTIRLSEPISRDDSTPQLAWAEGRLMLVLGGTTGRDQRRAPSQARGYTIDPRTGEVLFACFLEPQPDN